MSYYKPVFGDAFEFMMDGKYYYFQYLYTVSYRSLAYNKSWSYSSGRLIRYFREGFESPPDLNELFRSKETHCKFCEFVSRVWAKEIRFLGNYPVPERLKDPPECLVSGCCNSPATQPHFWYLRTRESGYQSTVEVGYYLPEKYRDFPYTSFGSFSALKTVIVEGEFMFGILREWPEKRVREWERLKALPPAESVARATSQTASEVHSNNRPVKDGENRRFIPLNRSMKELRYELSVMIREIRGYVEFSDSHQRAKQDVESLKSILSDYLASISGRKNDKTNLLASTKKAISRLNRLNKRTNNSLIETRERDNLCNFFINSGSYVGYDISDKLELWRDW